VEKLRLFVLKGVANELQKPAKDKKPGGKHPERMIENGRHCKRQRHHDQWNAKAMAKPVDRMSMAASILRDPLFAAASTKHGRIINPDMAAQQFSAFGLLRARPVRSQILLRRKQKDPRGPGMHVAICCDLLMLADLGTLDAKGDDLAFFIDGKSPNQHNITRKIGDRFVQINQPILAGPKESAGPHGACYFAHYLPCVIDVEGFAVNCAGLSTQGLHSGSACPDKSPNASAASEAPTTIPPSLI